ncbi:hypothetical protein [Sphingomonas sp. M1-B02]|uniref:hypothetical protein n=1 Tax=Sphingomonas sp. M1-B02 TaxID=3114300 RepID=UPI0022402C3A|nr:hypothetical protein [Sphingomonas sp. S6-11]UZK66881.1 hypothetical protein OKW87_03330 [Sphingomonas sp. S6-11]
MALLLALAACSGGDAPADKSEPRDLETVAIERGLVRDVKNSEIAGLYARDTDRVCIVPAGLGYRIGAFVDYGDGVTCSGSGTVSRVGDRLRVELGQGDACGFDARFGGDRIDFPGSMPDGCASLCAGRASFAGLEAARMSESVTEARAMRDADGKRLCSE